MGRDLVQVIYGWRTGVISFVLWFSVHISSEEAGASYGKFTSACALCLARIGSHEASLTTMVAVPAHSSAA